MVCAWLLKHWSLKAQPHTTARIWFPHLLRTRLETEEVALSRGMLLISCWGLANPGSTRQFWILVRTRPAKPQGELSTNDQTPSLGPWRAHMGIFEGTWHKGPNQIQETTLRKLQARTRTLSFPTVQDFKGCSHRVLTRDEAPTTLPLLHGSSSGFPAGRLFKRESKAPVWNTSGIFGFLRPSSVDLQTQTWRSWNHMCEYLEACVCKVCVNTYIYIYALSLSLSL